MKLIKYTPKKGEDGENIYTNIVEMTSVDSDTLKSKASDLCRIMGIEPAFWESKYAVMGAKEIQTNYREIMKLNNGIVFAIDK